MKVLYRLIITTLIWCGCHLSVMGQALKVDSMRHLVQHTDPHEASFLTYLSDLGYAFEQAGDWDSALYYYKLTQRHALSIKQLEVVGKNARYTGLLYYGLGDMDSAFSYSEKAIQYLQQSDSFFQLGKALTDKGNVLTQRGAYLDAIDTYLVGIEQMSILGYDSLNTILYANIGFCYHELDQFANAIYFNRKALEIARDYRMRDREAFALVNLGSNYLESDELGMAEEILSNALTLAQGIDHRRIMGGAYGNLGSLAAEKEDFDRAIALTRLAIQHEHDPTQRLYYRSSLGFYFAEIGQYDSSAFHLEAVKKISQREQLQEHLREVYGHLLTLEEYRGNHLKALANAKQYILLSDTIHNREAEELVAKLAVAHQTARQERENQQLRETNYQQQVDLLQAQASSRRSALWLGIFILISLALMVGFLTYRRDTRQKALITQQRADLDRQALEDLQHKQQIQVMKALVEGQEAERSRLAKDLHDGLGGRLSSLKLQVERKHILLPPDLIPHLDEISSGLTRVSEEMRQIAHNLMPANLVHFGLIVALEDYISDIRFSGAIQIDFQHYGFKDRLPIGQETAIYRILQELINNVLKHAEASEMLVQLFREGDRLHITVEDNGKGFDLTHPREARHSGLDNIRSRLEFFQGSLDIQSKPKQGTSMLISLYVQDPTTRRG